MKEKDTYTIKKSTVALVVVVVLTYSLGYMTPTLLGTEPVYAENTNPIVTLPPPTQQPPPTNGVLDLAGTDNPFKGDPNAPITIVEFSDFQCPFCGNLYRNLKGNIDQYIDDGTVKFVYRDFPLRSIHPSAQISAQAAECANEKGKFWEYHDILFENTQQWSSSSDVLGTLISYGNDLGIDITNCLVNGDTKDKVDTDYNDAVALGVQSTPTLFVNGEKIIGAVPWATVEQTINNV